MALLAAALIFVVMPAVARRKGEARRAAQAVETGEIVDILSDANPGVPWCWSVLTLQKAAGGPPKRSSRVVRRFRSSRALARLVVRVSAADERALGRDDGAASDTIVWHRRWRIDVEELRALDAANCRVRAWLQFGRVPHVAKADRRSALRASDRQNFTPMAVEQAPWLSRVRERLELPRRDVLTDSSDSR